MMFGRTPQDRLRIDLPYTPMGDTFAERFDASGASPAEAYRAGGLAAMDQYNFGIPHEVFGAYDRAQWQAERDAKERAVVAQQLEQRPHLLPQGVSPEQAARSYQGAQKQAEQFVSDYVVPNDVLGATMMLGGGVGAKALGGVLLGADAAEAAGGGRKIIKPRGLIHGKDAEKLVENWRLGDIADTSRLNVPQTELFDYRRIAEIPDVKQFDLPRYDPPRGVSARVQDLVQNERVRQLMLQKLEEGKSIGPGAEKFYGTEPLRQAFVEELGKKKAPEAFGRYMDYASASSPRSKVPANVRNASYYYVLDRQGLPMPEIGTPNPAGYGHMAQKLHQQGAQLVHGGGWDILKNPKPPSFSQNLQGNLLPVTVDAHAFKLPAMLSEDPRFLATSVKPEKDAPSFYPARDFASGKLTMEEAVKDPKYWVSAPNANEYGAMEQYYKRLAEEVGLQPAQGQGSGWAAGGPITGLGSVAGEPFVRTVENVAIDAAKKRGISPQEALSQMIRGVRALSIGGAAALGAHKMGGVAAQDQYQ